MRTSCAVFACAFLSRAAYLALARPDFEYEHWEMAGSLLRHGTLGFNGVPTTQFEPLYPMLVAAFRWITGDRVVLAQLLQVGIGAAAAVALYGLTLALTGARRTALVAGLLFACYPLSIRHAADGTDVTVMATLLAAFCWTTVGATTPARGAAAGVWLGLATLTRSMALPLVPCAAIALLVRRRVGAAAACVTVALALFAPYALRNHALNGSVLPTRTGVNLLVSNSRYTQALVPAYHADFLEEYAESLLKRDGLSSEQPLTPALERQQDLALRRDAWDDMKTRPFEMIWLRVKYAALFLSPVLIPTHEHGNAPEVHLGPGNQARVDGSPLRPWWLQAIYAATYGPVLVLALAGMVARRHRIAEDAVLWAVLATFVAAHSVFFPATRYRVPMDFVLLFYAAVAAMKLIAPQPVHDGQPELVA